MVLITKIRNAGTRLKKPPDDRLLAGRLEEFSSPQGRSGRP